MTTAASPLQRLGLLWRLHWRDLRRLLRYSLVLVAAPRLGQRCIVLHLADVTGGAIGVLGESFWRVQSLGPLTGSSVCFFVDSVCVHSEVASSDWGRTRSGYFFDDSDCVHSEWRLGWDVGKYLIVDALQFGRAPDCLAVEGKRWPWRIVGGALFSWCGAAEGVRPLLVSLVN